MHSILKSRGFSERVIHAVRLHEKMRLPTTEKRNELESRRRARYHEAGHAVMAVYHNIVFESVVLRSDGRGALDIRFGPLDEDGECYSGMIDQWQELYAAGAAAELLVFGDYQRKRSRVDEGLHRQLQARFSPGRSPEWERDVNRARHTLCRCDVETIAVALDQRESLTEDEVWVLLGREIP